MGGSQIYRDGRLALAAGFFGGSQKRLSKAWLVYAFHMHKRYTKQGLSRSYRVMKGLNHPRAISRDLLAEKSARISWYFNGS